MRRADDDVGDGWGDADLDAGVALLGELTLEELVQLGVEDTVCAGILLACEFTPPSLRSVCPKIAAVEGCNPSFPGHLLFLGIFCCSCNIYAIVGGFIPATNFLRLELSHMLARDSELWLLGQHT